MAESQILLDADGVRRTLLRIAHQILERNRGGGDLVLLGIPLRGVPLARRLAEQMGTFEGVEVPVGSLDVGLYRDDVGMRPAVPLRPTQIPVDVTDRTVVLVDDVIQTGRTVRAALEALMHLGRPARVQLVAFVDRGGRELPLQPDFVGLEIAVPPHLRVRVRLEETDGVDQVVLEPWA